MKSTELMVGDLVLLFGDTPARVDAIGDTKVYVYEKERGDWHVGYEHIKPTPLTAEILEKNGFTRSTRNGGYYLYADESYSNQTMEIILFHVDSEYNSNQLHICYAVSSSDHVMLHLMSCNHVHELQHALRLCGIEKEIVL